MNKIKRISHCFSILAWCFLLLWLAAWITGWVIAPHTVTLVKYFWTLNVIPSGLKIHGTITCLKRCIGLLAAALPCAMAIIGSLAFIQLMRAYTQGKIFSVHNMLLIKRIAWMLILYQVCRMIYDMIISFMLTWHNPPKQEKIIITMQGMDIGLILIGVLALLIAWVMSEAIELQKEQSLTI